LPAALPPINESVAISASTGLVRIDFALGIAADNTDCKKAKARSVIIGGAHEVTTNVFREYLFPRCSSGLLVYVEVASSVAATPTTRRTTSDVLPVDDDIMRSITGKVYLPQPCIELRIEGRFVFFAPVTNITDATLCLGGGRSNKRCGVWAVAEVIKGTCPMATRTMNPNNSLMAPPTRPWLASKNDQRATSASSLNFVSYAFRREHDSHRFGFFGGT
jgi:hypothetical protein